MRRWRPGDEGAFARAAVFAGEREALGWDWRQGPPGPTWTLEREGAVVGVGGGRLMGKVWECWASLAEVSPRDWPTLIWIARTFLGTLEGPPVAEGFRAWCRLRPETLRVVERLGFVLVGMAEDAELGVYARLERRIV